MQSNIFNNPLRNPFVGSWTVLAKVAGKGKNTTTPDIKTVEINLRASSKNNFYSMKMKDKTIEGVPHWHLCADTSSNTISGALGTRRIQISFWRFSSYDMIFGLIEEGESESFEIWSAKRDHTENNDVDLSNPPNIESLTEIHWNIVLTTGFHGASGCVRLKKLGGEASDGSGPTIGTGLFGLFHYDSVFSPSAEGQLYDILAYDATVQSYNSIFGVRSLNYHWSGDTSKCRVFATFNNKFSIPATHFPSGSQAIEFANSPQQPQHKIGSLMRFELPDPDSDDPDVGTWVGEPG